MKNFKFLAIGVALLVMMTFYDIGRGQKPKADPPIGTVATVRLNDAEQSKWWNNQLHFCVFDDGDTDYVYVGTKYGMWSNGEFDLSINGHVVFTGEVSHLTYEGVILQMGDALEAQPRSNFGVEITRVTGNSK